jgi:predicted NBD/HSP70 family sugar kinase
VNIFNPQVIILGGFITGLFAKEQQRLLAGLKYNSLAAANERVLIRESGLGSNMLMIGAAELPFNELITRPSTTSLISAKAKAPKA